VTITGSSAAPVGAGPAGLLSYVFVAIAKVLSLASVLTGKNGTEIKEWGEVLWAVERAQDPVAVAIVGEAGASSAVASSGMDRVLNHR
jgi:hypothetical protein